ncbi:MAG: glycoside hydrolase family 88 protein [Clostridia bacterium]|nr:glycoside hydrolase family 88 protein [Clostridia bacterium]
MSDITEQNRDWIDSTFEKIDKKLQKVAVRSRNKLPYTADEKGVHDNKAENQIFWWTNGFWGGMMWLMYSYTQNEEYLKTARESGKMVNKIFANYKHIDHDAGFLWHLTAGADYRLTENMDAWNANMLAASCLYSRYRPDSKYIIAWNGPSNRCLTIIDCLMNLPLLYWASEQVKDNRFAKAAQNHADMSLRDHIRKDGSIYHQVVHDLENGEFIEARAGQGYSVDSCWTRGLAWAVYGMLISHIHTGDKKYLDASVKCADYFIKNVKNFDWLPPADFGAPKEYFAYDSTAGACTAAGLIELAKYVPDKKDIYIDAAIKVLKAIDEKCANYDESIDYLVNLGSLRCPREDIEDAGTNMPIIYGDFFYVEAILKLKGNEFFIW